MEQDMQFEQDIDEPQLLAAVSLNYSKICLQEARQRGLSDEHMAKMLSSDYCDDHYDGDEFLHGEFL